jgi:RNA-directed DNA polymerase
MSGQRQKIQLELAFPEPRTGATRMSSGEGTEPLMAERRTESPASTERLMEEVCECENLKKALRRVRANRGSPGMDGLTVDDLSEYLREHWPAHREELLQGTYTPQPVKRVEIPKSGGGKRKLGIPTVLDRFVQQAVLQVLQPRFDPTFSEHSFGFRPQRTTHQAVARAQEYVAQGHRYVVDIDLEKFFDQVHHDRLMSRLAARIADKRLLRLIRAFLNAGVMEGGLVSRTEQGTPQGGPLSPLLSNVVLDELDRELERRGHRFVRYADDCNVYVRSQRAGERVMESLGRFIERKLRLRINRVKSAVARPWERSFLGFSFTNHRKPKRRIAPKAMRRFRSRVKELTRRTRGISTEQMVDELGRYLRGWHAYFCYCETPTVLDRLDKWVRRRMRCMIWKQWQRGGTRYRALKRRGIESQEAFLAAYSNRGPWRLTRTKAVCKALPNAYFDSLGLPRLSTRKTA